VKLSVKVLKELDEVLAELSRILLEEKRVRIIFTLAEFFWFVRFRPAPPRFRIGNVPSEARRAKEGRDANGEGCHAEVNVGGQVEPHNQTTSGLQKKSVLRSPEPAGGEHVEPAEGAKEDQRH
jgi:hypothetical protein